MSPFDLSCFSSGRPMVEPVESLFEMGDGERVFATPELTGVVVLDPLDGGRDHGLHEGTVRLRPLGASAKRPFLPVDVEADTLDVPASRVPRRVVIVLGLERLVHGFAPCCVLYWLRMAISASATDAGEAPVASAWVTNASWAIWLAWPS